MVLSEVSPKDSRKEYGLTMPVRSRASGAAVSSQLPPGRAEVRVESERLLSGMHYKRKRSSIHQPVRAVPVRKPMQAG